MQVLLSNLHYITRIRYRAQQNEWGEDEIDYVPQLQVVFLVYIPFGIDLALCLDCFYATTCNSSLFFST